MIGGARLNAIVAGIVLATVPGCADQEVLERSRNSIAGNVSMQHLECNVSSNENLDQTFLYRIAFRRDSGEREEILTDQGAKIVRLPILEGEIIRPDGSRLVNVQYASVPQKGTVSLFGTVGTAAYLDIDKLSIVIADAEGPVQGDGYGSCVKVRPSDAKNW
jgi:hypothetical protein